MHTQYDFAKAEIATRLHHAEHRRSAKHARSQHQRVHTPRWQRFRST